MRRLFATWQRWWLGYPMKRVLEVQRCIGRDRRINLIDSASGCGDCPNKGWSNRRLIDHCIERIAGRITAEDRNPRDIVREETL
jgi:hypothetical protein